MSEQQVCPVCGAPREASGGPACGVCGFRASFVSLFASPAAEAFWRSEVERNAKPPLPAIQELLADRLSFGGNTVGIRLDDAYYLVDGVYGTTSRYEDVLQVSIGAHHTAVLKCDGTVTASGSNSFGQCDVSSLHDIRQVIAAASCTYALRQDDIVQVAGKTDSPELVTQALPGEMLPALEGWDDVLRLAYSPGHLSALHKKVHVSSNVRLQMHDLTHLLHENDMQKAIAAGRDYTLVLRKDGTVRYDGEKKDVGSAVKLWKDVRAIAGDSLYAIGLTPDGRLHLAGGSPSSVLAAGRTDAAQWENVAAVTCGDSVIAAVTADGELLLAGNAPRRTELLDTWARDVRPALLHMIYSLN